MKGKTSIKQKLAIWGGLALLLLSGCDKDKVKNFQPQTSPVLCEKLQKIVETYGNDPYNYMVLYKKVKTAEGLNKNEEIHVDFPKVLRASDEQIKSAMGGNGLIYLKLGRGEESIKPYINMPFIREVMKDCKEMTDDSYVNGWEFKDFLEERLDTEIYLKANEDARVKVPIKYKSTIEKVFDKFVTCDEKEGTYFSLYFKDKDGQEQRMNFITAEEGESKYYNMIDEALNAMKGVYGKDAKVTSDQIFAVYQQIAKDITLDGDNADTGLVDSEAMASLKHDKTLYDIKTKLGLNK